MEPDYEIAILIVGCVGCFSVFVSLTVTLHWMYEIRSESTKMRLRQRDLEDTHKRRFNSKCNQLGK